MNELLKKLQTALLNDSEKKYDARIIKANYLLVNNSVFDGEHLNAIYTRMVFFQLFPKEHAFEELLRFIKEYVFLSKTSGL